MPTLEKDIELLREAPKFCGGDECDNPKCECREEWGDKNQDDNGYDQIAQDPEARAVYLEIHAQGNE